MFYIRKSISKSIKTLECILTIQIQWYILNRRSVIKTELSKGDVDFGFGCINNGSTASLFYSLKQDIKQINYTSKYYFKELI